MRKPMPQAEIEARMREKNALLDAEGEPPMLLPEAMAARLYTGPLYVKYNAVLRGLNSRVPLLRGQFMTLCRGNKYATTIHCINSAVVKLSKLTVATKVYRGVSGMALPDHFNKPNDYGVRGGIEGGFMSTTADREVALSYASNSERGGFVFEIRQGMIDRGADICCYSQYPHESEVLWAPPTGLEVHGVRVEDAVLVVGVSPSINLTALTIEQVIGKRLKLLSDMGDSVGLEVQGLLGPAVGPLAAKLLKCELEAGVLGDAPGAYNADPRFKSAVDAVLEAKELALSVDGRLPMMDRWIGEAERVNAVAQLRATGVVATEVRVAEVRGGFAVEVLRQGGYDVRALRSVDARGRPAATDAELKASGVDAAEMREVGATVAELQKAGYTCTELRNAGFDAATCKAGGFDARQLREAFGLSAQQCKELGFDAPQLRAVFGLSLQQCYEIGASAGLTCNDCKEAGFSMGDVKRFGFSFVEASEAGYHAMDLLNAQGGYTNPCELPTDEWEAA